MTLEKGFVGLFCDLYEAHGGEFVVEILNRSKTNKYHAMSHFFCSDNSVTSKITYHLC
jgi:hypothetical protein